MLDYARTRGWVDDEHGAVRGHVERRASTPVIRRGRRPGVSRELRDAVLLSFDNLGEAADLERGTAPARGAAPLGDRRAAARARGARRAGPARDLLRRGPERRALSRRRCATSRRPATRSGCTAGATRSGTRCRPTRRTSCSAAASPPSRASASRSRASGRRAAGSGAHTLEALAAHGLRWCSPAGERAGRTAGVALPALPLARGRRLPPTRVLHRPAHRLGATGRPSPRRARPPMRSSAPSTRGATTRSCSSCTPSSCSRTPRRRRRGGCSSTWPGRSPGASAGWRRAASSRRWWARSCRAHRDLRRGRGPRAGVLRDNGVVDAGGRSVRELLAAGRARRGSDGEPIAAGHGPAAAADSRSGQDRLHRAELPRPRAPGRSEPPATPTFFAKYRNALAPPGATVELPASARRSTTRPSRLRHRAARKDVAEADGARPRSPASCSQRPLRARPPVRDAAVDARARSSTAPRPAAPRSSRPTRPGPLDGIEFALDPERRRRCSGLDRRPDLLDPRRSSPTSRVLMTLEPGDIVFLGTPSGVGRVRDPPVLPFAGVASIVVSSPIAGDVGDDAALSAAGATPPARG